MTDNLKKNALIFSSDENSHADNSFNSSYEEELFNEKNGLPQNFILIY
jgi:hypothetical protein